MKLLWYYIIYLFLGSELKKTGSTKLLIENPGFDDIRSWIKESKPYDFETVVFPKQYEAVLPLPKHVNVGGFVLSLNGAIVLNENGYIQFSHNIHNEEETKSILKKPSKKTWYNPKNWVNFPNNNMIQNSAIPDLERIPCDNETVIISSNGPITIDLENVNFLRLGQLYLTGALITKEYLKYLLRTELGSILFKNSDNVAVEYYRKDVCGCHLDGSYLTDTVCHNIEGECAIPYCFDPVIPFGSCCAICGGVLNYHIDNCNIEILEKARKLLSKKSKEQKLNDELDIYVNFYENKNYGKYIQIISVDRNEYNERSVKFLHYINSTEDWKKLFNEFQLIRQVYSGRYYNPHLTLFSIFLIIFCILLVLFVSLIILAHYQPNLQILELLPIWIYDVRHWPFFTNRPDITFARFDQHNEFLVFSTDEMNEDNLSLKSNTNSICCETENEVLQSFNNPMCETLENLVSDDSNLNENNHSLIEETH